MLHGYSIRRTDVGNLQGRTNAKSETEHLFTFCITLSSLHVVPFFLRFLGLVRSASVHYRFSEAGSYFLVLQLLLLRSLYGPTHPAAAQGYFVG